MNSLWTKIGLGALGVFAVGLVFVGLAHDAADSLTERLHPALAPVAAAADEVTPSPAGAHPVAQLAGLTSLASELRGAHGSAIQKEMAFRLDGRRIGTIRRLVLQRNSRNEVPAMNFTVDLNSRAEADRLTDCALLVADGDGSGIDEGFSCSEAGNDQLVTVGWARFEPTGESRPVAVSVNASRRMRDGDPFKATIEPDGQVLVEASGKDGGRVQVQANDGGARIMVDDAMGQALLRLLADSTGARLHVRGKDGKEIVHLEASQAGFSLVIDTSAAH
jgi:hypothetical protein